MEFLNEFTNGTGKDSNPKDLILLILIGVLVLGFGKNKGSNLFTKGEKDHKHHGGG